jgi:hypothetical protein
MEHGTYSDLGEQNMVVRDSVLDSLYAPTLHNFLSHRVISLEPIVTVLFNRIFHKNVPPNLFVI